MCKDCRRLRNISHKTVNAEIRKRHYEKNKEYILAKLQTDKNPEKLERIKQYNVEYAKRNRKRISEKRKAQYPQEMGQRRAWSAKRRAAKLRACPTWLTLEQLEEIKQIYFIAKEKQLEEEIAYDVDHIVPLLGENVCGLHVPWNLRVISATENRRKGNKYDPI